jgi:hypothetical protein
MKTLLNQLARVETALGLGEDGRGDGLVEVPAMSRSGLAAYRAMRRAWGDDLPEEELAELAGPVWLPAREARLAGHIRELMAGEGLKFLADPERFAVAMESIAAAEGRRLEAATRTATASVEARPPAYGSVLAEEGAP